MKKTLVLLGAGALGGLALGVLVAGGLTWWASGPRKVRPR